MPGTAFPEDNEDAATAAGDPVDTHTLGQSLADALDGWTSGAGRTEGDVARSEALERLRQQFLGMSARDMEPRIMEPSAPPIKHLTEKELINPKARVQKWADVAMWEAPQHTDPQRPKVTVSVCTPDPLGVMAMVNAQYTGRNLTDPLQVTDEERREAWEAATVSKLSETPLEWIQWSINFENVSRAFTHQLVRTRMATYAQESMRFGVKDQLADSTKMPPSLAGTLPWDEFAQEMAAEGVDPRINASEAQLWRKAWDEALLTVQQVYEQLVDNGMPAEDARGLLPTNILTRVHMRVDMKTLLHLAGLRLFTQAQFEWRAVFAELAEAIRAYGFITAAPDTQWQYNLMADSFRPVCYAAGHCPMKAKSDRYCSIQKRVDAFAEIGRDSSTWGRSWAGEGQTVTAAQGVCRGADDKPVKINAIHPAEWLADPTAARKAPGQE
jgi:flavin-dependent thymidylate synthase